MPFLRVQLLALQAQEPWRYYVSFQLQPSGVQAAGTHLQQHNSAAGATTAGAPDTACRTDTARPSSSPEFSSRTFVLRLAATDAADAARLAVSLFAAPSVEAPAGPIIAGREIDRLVASAVLDLEPQLLQRLSQGEQVVLPVPLQEAPESRLQQMPDGLGSQAAQLQSLRSSQQQASQGSGSSSRPHVLLELMLLDTEVAHARDAADRNTRSSIHQQLAAAAGAAAAAAAGLTGRGSDGDDGDAEELGVTMLPTQRTQAGGRQGADDLQLLVLVSAASNVPLVPGSDGQLQPPSALVALRVGTDAAPSALQGPPQASTTAAAPSLHPSWGQLLHLQCNEAQLSHSRLHIALSSQQQASNACRVLAKGSLRLSGLLPGQHYSLALALTDSCTLYVTVVLGLGCKTLLAALQGSGLSTAAAGASNKLQLLALGVPMLEQPLSSLLPAAMQQSQGAPYGILAVWRCDSSRTGTASTGPQQQQQQAYYIPLDAQEGREAASAAMLRVYNSNHGLLAVGSASRANSAASSRDAAPGAAAGGAADSSELKGLSGVLAVLPVFNSQDQQQQQKQQDSVPWPPQHQVLLPLLMEQQTSVTLELHLQRYVPAASSSSNKGGSSSSRLPASLLLARLTLPLAAVAGQPVGKPRQLSGLQLSLNPQVAAASASSMQVALQVTRWDVAQYQQQLVQQQAQQQQLPALLPSHSPIPPPARKPPAAVKSKPKAGAAAAAAAAVSNATREPAAGQACAAGSTLQLLLGDVLDKQQALQRLQRQLDLAGQCAEAANGRIAELRAANSTLSSDLQHLRQLLHEEKEAAAAGSSLLDATQSHLLPGTAIPLAAASREQVLQQLAIVLGKHATERARNAELVRRLQQLHAEKVDVMELQRQYLELQEAHFQQSKLLVDQKTQQHGLSTLKRAVTNQEALIQRLQQLLAAAAARAKELEAWRGTAATLQQEVHQLRGELADVCAAGEAAEQRAAAQAAAATLADCEAAASRAAASFEVQLSSKESDRLAAAMRAERAETSAVAAQNELMEVTKRYAREIAQLKTRLAEKDAQLLGGFGSIDHLTTATTLSSSTRDGLLQQHQQPYDLQAPGSQPLAVGATGGFGGLPSLQDLQALGVGPLAGAAAEPQLWHSGGGGSRNSSQRFQPPAGRGSASGRGQTQQQQQQAPSSYIMRAGSAEARLMMANNQHRQGSTAALDAAASLSAHGAQTRSVSSAGGLAKGSNSKPGSPLLPTAAVQQQQQRLVASADGIRSPSGSMMGASRAAGRVSRDAPPSPQQAWAAAASPRGQPHKAAVEPEQGLEDEYEDVVDDDDEEDEEAEEEQQEQQQQQRVQPESQPAARQPAGPSSPQAKKRGGLAGFFSRG